MLSKNHFSDHFLKKNTSLITKQDFFSYSFIALLFIAAWVLQDHLFLNWDVSWLIQASEKSLKGGTFSNDYFSPNPPMILYLYTPSVFISQFLHISIPIAFRSYIFFLAFVSFLICNSLANDIFKKEDSFLKHTFLITLIILFIILPMHQLGQRDHLLFILSMPYLLKAAYQLQTNSNHSRLSVTIGLLAGLGFAVKPQFLITPILIELYFIFCKRNLFAWLRAETITIMGVLIFYVIMLFICYQDFSLIIVPYLLKTYYHHIGLPLHYLIFNSRAISCYLPIAIYIALYKRIGYNYLNSILIIALISFLLSYFSQHTIFLHHIIPAISMAILLLALQFFSFISVQPKKIDYMIMIVPMILSIMFLFYRAYGIWTTSVFNPALFFCFFGVLFFVILYVNDAQKQISKILFSVLIILSFSFICSYPLLSSLDPFTFPFCIITMILCFILILININKAKNASDKTTKKLFHQVFTVILGMLIFAYPVFNSYYLYLSGKAYKEVALDKLIKFMKTQDPHQSIYVLSTIANIASPLTYYTSSTLAQRVDCLWMINDFTNYSYFKKIKSLSPAFRNNKDFVLNMVADDFFQKKPSLVFVDISDRNTLINGISGHLNFLDFFSQSPSFQNEWRSYRYLTNLEFGRYKFQIYKRYEKG